MSDIKDIEDKILVEISKTQSLKELQEIKIKELGKKRACFKSNEESLSGCKY